MNKELLQKKNDYLLELALEEQLEQDKAMEKYGEEVIEPHEFSSEHEAKMKELFRQAAKMENQGERRRTRIQVAAGFLGFLCCSTLMVTQVEAFRVPGYNLFTEVKEKATRFGVVEETEVEISDRYRAFVPEYVPEGYEIVRVEEGKNYIHISYINEEDNKSYNYNYRNCKEEISIDTEHAVIEEISIRGNQSYIVREKDQIRLLIYKENATYYLVGNVPESEAIKILENIN